MKIRTPHSRGADELSILIEHEDDSQRVQPFVACVYADTKGEFYTRFYPSGRSKMDVWDRDLQRTREEVMEHILAAAEYWLENFYQGRHS